MIQYQVMRLPSEVTGKDIILRHWLVYDNGQIYFQDELLTSSGVDPIPHSEKTDWQQLPTPPMESPVVGIIDFGGMPLAMRQDGTSYIWGRVEGEIMEKWTPFLEKLPSELTDIGDGISGIIVKDILLDDR